MDRLYNTFRYYFSFIGALALWLLAASLAITFGAGGSIGASYAWILDNWFVAYPGFYVIALIMTDTSPFLQRTGARTSHAFRGAGMTFGVVLRALTLPVFLCIEVARGKRT